MGHYVKVKFSPTTTHKDLCSAVAGKIWIMQRYEEDTVISELRMAPAVHHTLILQDLDTWKREVHFVDIPITIDESMPITEVDIGVNLDGIDRAIGRIKHG